MTQPIGNPSHIGNLDASQLGPQPTYLPEDHPDVDAKKRIDAGEEPIDVAAALPASSLVWAYLPMRPTRRVASSTPMPTPASVTTADSTPCAPPGGAAPARSRTRTKSTADLRALYALGRAAGAIGEGEEAARIEEFLRSSDPSAAEAIGKGE